jgi:hypothetical protein
MTGSDWRPRSRTVALLAGAILAVGCGITPPEPKPRAEARLGLRQAAECPPSSSPDHFYPASAIPEFDADDASRRTVHAEFLKAADAPPLWCGPAAAESYRLLYLATSRPALLVSAEKTAEGWFARSVQFIDPRTMPHAPDRPPLWTVATAGMVDRTLGDGRAFESLRRAAGLWTMPERQENRHANDGAIWFMESRAEGLYRMVIRDRVPSPLFEAVARELVKLADSPVPPEMQPPPCCGGVIAARF